MRVRIGAHSLTAGRVEARPRVSGQLQGGGLPRRSPRGIKRAPTSLRRSAPQEFPGARRRAFDAM